jgi:hypothetical protein
MPRSAKPEADSPPVAMRVYRFAIYGDLPVEAVDEMYRGHQLRNQLVEIEQRHAERVAAVWAEHPEIAQLTAAVTAAVERLDALQQQTKDLKRSKRVMTVPTELRDAVKQARRDLRDAKTALRNRKAEINPQLREAFAAVGIQRRADIKALYRISVDGGLYWANYNEVVQHHEVAVRAIGTRRKDGQPADLRFHRWDGSGTLAVQLQRPKDAPVRSPLRLAEESGRYGSVAWLTPAHDPSEWEKLRVGEQRRAARGTLRFRVGSKEATCYVAVPVIVDRPIPPDADITMLRISRRRIAGHYRCHVSVVVRLPPVPKRTKGPIVSMHLGWRSRGDGSIRVAVVAGAGPVPDRIRPYVIDHDGWREIVAPAQWGQGLERIAHVRSRRDTETDAIRKALVAWAATHPDAVEKYGLEQVAKWRSPGRFASLAWRWVDDPPDESDAMVTQLCEWRARDRRRWEGEANGRDHIHAHRTDVYGKIAAWLCREARVVVIDAWDVAAVIRRPVVEDTDDWQARAARANRTLASPASLRALVSAAAEARGVTIQAPDIRLSQTHFVCGQELKPEERAAGVEVWCATCQTLVDQDRNALDHLIAASTEA